VLSSATFVSMITIGIIEDDPILRKNLETFIETQKDLQISFSLKSIEDFLANKSHYEEPVVVFCDLGLPGISGKEGIVYIREYWNEVFVVVITGNEDEDIIYDCIERGANGYILKPFRLNDLIEHIEIMREGGTLLSPKLAKKIFQQIKKQASPTEVKDYGLTPREKQVMNELLKGMTYKEIGFVLGISSTTVNDHLKNIYKKTGVRTKSDLIRLILQT
jgi:DNA-binding NarL/FixJ family response regulator